MGLLAPLSRPSPGPRFALDVNRDVGVSLSGSWIAMGEAVTLGDSCFPSQSTRHRSVRLRHIVSALRRTWRSATVAPLIMDAAEKAVPCGPAPPVITAS